ncbi:hypothetical protein C7999DRAFT_14802 [Corynascus novoguineensis]|uniref:Uncharacterized protein n=1 Tax=Corynascus novoguineensis TaxID=1126955 RepID=A0AAN7HIQ8_9PEZI|nr:hypothetical protein C7999DRAFT_14802 [Corynascus novoguineensis]
MSSSSHPPSASISHFDPHPPSSSSSSPSPKLNTTIATTNINTIVPLSPLKHSCLPFRKPPTLLEFTLENLDREPEQEHVALPTTTKTMTRTTDSNEEPTRHQHPHHALLVVRGLPEDVVDAATAEGLVPREHPSFVRDCLARRRPWRRAVADSFDSLMGLGRGRCRGWEEKDTGIKRSVDGGRGRGHVWEYPEVVELEAGWCPFDWKVAEVDVGRAPPVVMALGDGSGGQKEQRGQRREGRKFGVMFCRAGLWLGEEKSVLFLERDQWKGDGQGVRKVRRGVDVVVGEAGTEEKEIMERLEDILVEILGSVLDPIEMLPAVVAEAVYQQWLLLFDFLEPHPRCPLDETTAACYMQMMRSLELNDEAGNEMVWRDLITRLQRRIQLLSALQIVSPGTNHTTGPCTALAPTMPKKTTKRPNTPRRRIDGQKDKLTNFNLAKHPCRQFANPRKAFDENQRALDRLSYLAGVLIPLPIVSGILSMGDVYGPGGSRFYVFWAVAGPLAGLTLLLIYADTIRKAEVWVEIASDHVMPSPGGKRAGEDSGGSSSRSNGENIDGEKPSSGLPNHSVPVVADHEAEERSIDMPATIADPAMSVASEDENWLPRRRWSMGWVQVPRVILERPADGSKPRAWRREQLGWSGAIMTILYRKFRDGRDVPEGVAACEKPGLRKTNSY